MLTPEYFVSLGAAVLLGYLFYDHPLASGLMLMLAPTAISQSLHLLRHGFSAFWPATVIATLVFTIPYVGAAYLGAWLRRRSHAPGA